MVNITMEVPSSSGIPCITIDEDDLEFENNIIRKQEDVIIKSAQNSIDPSIKLQDIIGRLNTAKGFQKQGRFDELRACFAEKTQEEFASLLFRCVSITSREKNTCSLCQQALSSSYENITHIILVHNVSVNHSMLTKIANTKGTPNISKKNIAPGNSKNSDTDKLKIFLETCNRAKATKTRMNKYESLKKKYKPDFKNILNKLVQNMFDESRNLWICNNCKKTYKQSLTLAKHLFVEHRLSLEYESQSTDKKIKVERSSDDRKSTIINNVPSAEKSEIETFPQPPTDAVKRILLFAIYLAKSFPKSNLELLYELFKKLNYDATIFENLLKTENEFVTFMESNISLNFIKYLVRDVGESTFSIFINQYSNGDKKLLLLVIKYFSNEKNRMNTSFYRLIPVGSENYASQIKNLLNADGLNIEKCVGFGLDVVYDNEHLSNSNINGLKTINSRVAINRCIFQSLQLIAEKSCTHLPENLAIMIKEIYFWYMNLQSEQQNHNIVKLRNIEPKSHNHQWFTELEYIQFIFNQWDALKQKLSSINNCQAQYIVQNLFQDDINKVYLHFINQTLRPVLELQDSFLKESFDPLDLFKNLNVILLNLQVKQEREQAVTPNEFAVNMDNFIQYLVSELKALIPEESSILNKISFLSIESAKTTKRMQCLPFSNTETIRIFDHVAKFINEMTDELPAPIAEAFLIIRCQNDLSFLKL